MSQTTKDLVRFVSEGDLKAINSYTFFSLIASRKGELNSRVVTVS